MQVFQKLKDGTRVPMVKVKKNGRDVFVPQTEQAQQTEATTPCLARQHWPDVRETWAMAESFLLALASRYTQPPVTPEEKAKRWASCEVCECRIQRDGHSYCGVCNCPHYTLSQLDGEPGKYTKLDFPGLKCPLKKF